MLAVYGGNRRPPLRLFTIHMLMFQTCDCIAGAFIGAFLLKMGLSVPETIMLLASTLVARFIMRIGCIPFIRRFGIKVTILSGAVVMGLQYPALIYADKAWGILLWVLLTGVGDVLYWPAFHSLAAVLGEEDKRGRQLGTWMSCIGVSKVLGPIAGGYLLSRYGAASDFLLAAVLSALSTIPLLMLRMPEPEVPGVIETLKMTGLSKPARNAVFAFGADGYLSSGLMFAWPVILFITLGENYTEFGLANAAAGLVGAVASVLSGNGIDKGHRNRWLILVTITIMGGVLLRSCAEWSVSAAIIANLSGAAIGGVYTGVFMSCIYGASKASGRAYAFQMAAESSWDTGAFTGSVIAAIMAVAVTPLSLCVLPCAAGMIIIHRYVTEYGAQTADG